MIEVDSHEDRRQQQLNVRVPSTLVEALKRRARNEGERESVVVRQILRDALVVRVGSNIETR